MNSCSWIKATDGDATVGGLAKQLRISQSAATQLVRRVENIGLIERTMSPHDARIHPLRLTREGKRLAAAVRDLADERTALAEALVDIGPDQQESG
jgi:DNA-binding MarR family transcriptional regulator